MAWHNVARLDAFGDRHVIGVEVDGTPVALYQIGDAIYAADGRCTHASGLLADGWVEDDTIECPLHQARFDIRTGKALCEPATEDLRTYAVKIEGTDILIDFRSLNPEPAIATGRLTIPETPQVDTAVQSNHDRQRARGTGNATDSTNRKGTLLT